MTDNAPSLPHASSSRYRHRSSKIMPKKSGWLLTFTDTIALMLTFFVMTYSMANPKQEIWDDIQEQVNMEFSTALGQVAQQGGVNDISLERLQFDRALNLSYLEALLTTQLIKRNLDTKVFMLPDPNARRLILTVPHEFLFTTGQADLTQESKKILKELASILKGIKNSLEIVGHTDSTPISQTHAHYNSNWDLSLQRAMNVAHHLKQNNYTHPIHVRGASDGLYTSLPPNLSLEERLSLSRRVDIIVYDKQENFQDRLGLK